MEFGRIRLAFELSKSTDLVLGGGRVPDIPQSLQFLFGPGEEPWAPLPDPGATPTVEALDSGVTIADGDYTVAADETIFADDGPVALLFSSDLPRIYQNGVLWNQSTLGEVASVRGNIDALYNYGSIISLSVSGVSRGVQFTDWGTLQNRGAIFAVSAGGPAVGYEAHAPHSYSQSMNNENFGEIVAWSGYFDPSVVPEDGIGATGAIIYNGATFINSGRLAAYGHMYAAAFDGQQADSRLTNTGLIEAYADEGGLAIGIRFSGGGYRIVQNSGVIRADNAIYVDYLNQSTVYFYNREEGEVYGDFYLKNSTDQIVNEGLIVGDIYLGVVREGGVTQPGTLDSIVNTGTIIGDIIGGADDVRIENRVGAIEGAIVLAGGNDTVLLSAIDDSLSGAAGNDALFGGAGADFLAGGSGDDTLEGELENDTLTGGAGSDSLVGQHGDDALYGGADNDVLRGGTQNDTLAGGDGDDLLYGDEGADALYGGAGADTLYGYTGDDLMTGNGGNDSLDGGPGDDTVLGGDGDDVVTGGDGNNVVSGTRGNDSVYGGDGDDTVVGGDGDDFVAGHGGINVVGGGLGSDTLVGWFNSDTLTGGDGDDWLYGYEGTDSLYGGAQNDRLFGGDDADLLAGAAGDDRLAGEAGDDSLFGGEGADTLDGGEGADSLYGNADADFLRGNWGDDLLNGGAGDDYVAGENDNDRLFGDVGNDTLDGGYGNDTMTGGAGNDNFNFLRLQGHDVITDFSAGAGVGDVIDIIAYNGTIDNFSDLLAAATDDGTNTIIDLDGRASITLNNVRVSELHPDDFLFA